VDIISLIMGYGMSHVCCINGFNFVRQTRPMLVTRRVLKEKDILLVWSISYKNTDNERQCER